MACVAGPLVAATIFRAPFAGRFIETAAAHRPTSEMIMQPITRLPARPPDRLPAVPDRASARAVDSLRWRLPFFFGALIVIMLGTFLWAMSRALEGGLVDAGSDRALVGADQVSGMLERPIATRMTESARYQGDSTLRAALRDPTLATLAAARRTLLPTATRALRRAELWDARGALILEIVTAPPDTAQGLRAYPRGARPTGGHVSEIKAAGTSNFFEIVTEIRDDSSRGSALLGYLRRFGRITSTAGSPIKRLLGDSAVVKIGSPAAGAWTDFYDVVPAAPALTGPAGSGEYRATDGRRWVGAADSIHGTPWQAWVGFPRTMIVAPAQPFMRRMHALALAFIAGGAALSVLLGARLTKPLRAMAGAAERIAAGDYSHRVAAGGRDEIGRLGEAFNTMTDRIEQAHTALEKSHEETHFALAAARIGVWEVNLATGRMQCSKSMHLLHRLPGGALPGTCDEFVNLLHEEDREAVRKILQGDTQRDEFDMQYRGRGPGGSLHYMEGKGRLIRDSAGSPAAVLGVSIDVTDRTRLEAQFRQSQKMEAIGQLAGGVAHDFNNLLTAIIGHGELLLEEAGDRPQARTDATEILKAADSAAKLTHQLLAFSRHQVMQPKIIGINTVISDTEKLLGRLIGARITLVTDLAGDLDPVKADAAQLQQVLLNLAVNARDAMPQGGTLSIASANVYLDEEYASEHEAVVPGRHVVISVSDTGTGMDAATQARLFEPFFTTKAMGKGTGLGLATVYGVVKQSGGHIYVYSELGRGTTFKIYFPSAENGIAAVRADRAPALRAPSGTATILVVDDNEPVRVVAQMILQRAGYAVLTASGAQEALEILAAAEPRPVLVVSDVILPGMTGPELYREIIARYPAIRAIFTSGYSPDAIAPHATLPQEVMFVEKPYTASKLVSKVREALAS